MKTEIKSRVQRLENIEDIALLIPGDKVMFVYNKPKIGNCGLVYYTVYHTEENIFGNEVRLASPSSTFPSVNGTFDIVKIRDDEIRLRSGRIIVDKDFYHFTDSQIAWWHEDYEEINRVLSQ